MSTVHEMKVGDAIKLLPKMLGQSGGQQVQQYRTGDMTDRYAYALAALDMTVVSLREAENELAGQRVQAALKLQEAKTTIAQLTQEKAQLESRIQALEITAQKQQENNTTENA